MLKNNYINSEGTICNEACLTCVHRNLCFSLLEYAGMIIQAGDKIRFDCERIKANPEHYKNKIFKRYEKC